MTCPYCGAALLGDEIPLTSHPAPIPSGCAWTGRTHGPVEERGAYVDAAGDWWSVAHGLARTSHARAEAMTGAAFARRDPRYPRPIVVGTESPAGRIRLARARAAHARPRALVLPGLLAIAQLQELP